MGGTVHAIVVQGQQKPDAVQLVLPQAASLQTSRLCNLRAAARSMPVVSVCIKARSCTVARLLDTAATWSYVVGNTG